MKKILSVLAISTLVFGSASAKKSVNLNYRNGASLWSFTNNGESDDAKFDTSAQQHMAFFALNAYNTGSDSLNLKASGDVLSFEAQVNPSVTGWNANKMAKLKIGANFGAFGILAGFNTDGEAVGSFRINKDADNWEGKNFETFKPGSMFKGSYAKFSINQINIGGGGATGLKAANRAVVVGTKDKKMTLTDDKTGYKAETVRTGANTNYKVATGSDNGLGFVDSELFLQLSFNLAIPNSDASFKLLGTIISDRAWAGSSNDSKGASDDAEWLGAANAKYNDGHLAYTVFAIFSKPSVFNAQAFIKMNPHCLGCDRDQVFVPGAYVEVMAIKNLDIMGGFTMSIVEGRYEDYAFDLRARYAINNALSITYFGNISVLNGDVADTAEISAEVGTYNLGIANAAYDYGTSVAGTSVTTGAQALRSNMFMWNFLNVRFVLSDTIVPQLGIGAITDLGNGINAGPQKGEGTELSVMPGVTFYAAKNAAINVGFNVTFRGIGKEEHPVSSAYRNNIDETATQQGLDVGFSIPVLFRVKM